MKRQQGTRVLQGGSAMQGGWKCNGGDCCSTLHGWQCFAATGKCNTAGGRQQRAHRGCRCGAVAAPARWRRRRAPRPAAQTAHLPAPALSRTAPPRWAPALRAPAGRPSRPGGRAAAERGCACAASSWERKQGQRRGPVAARTLGTSCRCGDRLAHAPGCAGLPPGFKCAGCSQCERFERLQTIIMTICSPS